MPRLAAVGHAYGHGGTRERPTLLSRRSAARARWRTPLLSEALGEHTCTTGKGSASSGRAAQTKIHIYSRNLTPESSGGVALTTPRNGLLYVQPDTVVARLNSRELSAMRDRPRAELSAFSLPIVGERSVDPQGSASPSPSGRNALRTMRCDHAPAGLTHRGAAHRHRHPAPARRGERAGQPAHQGAGWP